MDLPALKALLLIVSQGRPPFKRPESVSRELTDFIEQCTSFNAADRPTSSQLLQHPFLFVACEESEFIPLVRIAKEDAEKFSFEAGF